MDEFAMRRREFLALPLAIPAFGDDAVSSNTKAPQFPDREFNITKFGAVEGGKKDSTEAIAKATAACAAAGGGRVVVPEGVFLTGPIHLKNGVNLHVAKNATLLFNRDSKLYLPAVFTRWEGTECMGYSPFVYAFEQSNIAISGEGTLDGNANCDFWWNWSGKGGCGKKGEPTQAPARKALVVAADKDVPVKDRAFGEGSWLRPQFIQPYRCTNVLIEGVTIRNSPMWEINPVLCKNVTVRNVKISSHGPNNDGCNPESSSDVLIENCEFDTGDDCIAIKAGKDLDIQHGPTKNVVIQNCTMHSGHGAVTLGSEMAGGIEEVYAQDLVFQNANWATNPLNMAIRLKSNMNRGGYLRNFYARNISIPNGVRTEPGFYNPLPGMPVAPNSVASTAGAIVIIDCDYAPAEDNVRIRPPTVSNVHISNVTVGNVAMSGGHYSGYQALVVLGPVAAEYNGPKPAPAVLPVSNITISDCDFGTPAAANPFFLFNAKDIKLENVKVGGKVINTTLASS